MNIAENLRSLRGGLEILGYKGSMVDPPTNFDTDYLFILSAHKMKNPKPMLTVHLPGNWDQADFGGESKTLNVAYAAKLKQVFLELVKSSVKNLGWEVSLEADHHGPTCTVPIIYIELGSSEKEWTDKKAGSAVAEAVINSLSTPSKCISSLVIGTGHYPVEANNLLLNTNLGVSHILPKYSLSKVEDSTLDQAILKSLEPVKYIYSVKKSLKSAEKKKLSDFCSSRNLEYIEI